MAKPTAAAAASPSSSPLPPPSLPVFLDSTLDTHLAMLVSLDDAVADLKRKVETEHAISFPEIGQITVRAIKVRKKGYFYHLSDSMLVRSAFDGIKGTRFLYIEAVPTSGATHQAGCAQNPAVEDGGKLEHEDKDHSEHKLNVLLGSSRGENCELNEVPLLDESFGKGDSAIIQTNQTNLKTVVAFHAHSYSSLSEVDRIAIEKENLSKEKSRERNEVLEEIRMLDENCTGDGGVKHVQDYTDIVVDQEKDHGQEEHGNSSVEANDESTALLVSEREKSSKEKSREKVESEKAGKENSREQNEVLMEDRTIDQHPELVSSPEKKRRKKAKISSSAMLVEDPVIGINSQSREETSELGTVPVEASTHEQHESDMALSKELTSKEHIGDPALPKYPDDNEKKKKRRRRSSKASKEVESGNQSDIVDAPFDSDNGKSFPEAATNDNSLANIEAVISMIEQAIQEQDNPEEAVENNYEELNKESDKDIRNGANADSADLDFPDPLSTKSSGVDHKTDNQSKDRRVGLSNDVLNEDFVVNSLGKVTDLNQEIPSDGNHSQFARELNDAGILKESIPERNHAEVEPKLSMRSLGRRKKSKNDPSKISSRKSDPANTLGDVTEEISKEVDDVRASVEARVSTDSATLYSVDPSDGNVKIVSRRKRKDSAKHVEPNDHGTIYSSSEKGNHVTEKNYDETVDDRHNGQDKESKEADARTEVVAPVDSAVLGSGSPPDKKSRRRRKKASKNELQNQDAIPHEVTDPLGKEVNEEKSKTQQENGDRVSAKARRGTPENSEKTMQGNRKDSIGDTHWDASKEALEAGKYKSSAECVEANEPMVNRNSDSEKINFVDYFVPSKVHEPSPEELPAMEAETMKQSKEKPKRKRKTDVNTQSSNPGLVNFSNEQPMIDRKIQDTDAGSHSLDDTMPHLRGKETRDGKASKAKTVKNNSKSDVDLGQTSSALVFPLENKSQDSLSSRKQHRKDTNKLKEKMSEPEKYKHVINEIGTTSISTKEVPQHGNDNALVKDFSVNASASQNNSLSRAEPYHNEAIADLVASSDSTEEDTPSLAKRYKVAVRKIPHRRSVNALYSTTQEKTIGASSGAIFHGATSDSSEDESDIINRNAMEATSDSSSTSSDSDGDHDEVGRQKKGISSADCDNKASKADNGGISLSQSSIGPKTKLPLGTILRSSSSYKKAKLTASQSQADDSESQPVDVVLETQPDLD